MKFRKITAIVLAVVALCAFLPSCGSVETVKDVRFSAITTEKNGKQKVLCNVYHGDLSSDGELTVMDAVIALLEQNGTPYKISADGKSFSSIASKSESKKGGYQYYWTFTINGEEPQGRACDILVHDGDKIVYYHAPDLKNVDVDPDDGTDDGEDVVDTESDADADVEEEEEEEEVLDEE